MERNGATASSSAQNDAERGAGGKFRKPSSRRPPPSPYARPPQQNEAQKRRWLSKLVDPAYRLISGGATLMLPSIFAKPSQAPLPASENQQQEEDRDNLDRELEENSDGDDDRYFSNHKEFRPIGPSDPSNTAEASRNASVSYRCEDDKKEALSDNGGLSEIEQLMKGKTFSRDEVNRLLQIIQSKAVDPSDAEPKNKYKYLTARADGDVNEHLTKSIEEKQEDASKIQWGASTPLPRSLLQNEVGASPIDIARAYMGSRTTEVSLVPKSILPKDDRTSLNGDESALRPVIPSPSPKPSKCWPGALSQDQHGYLTPQNEIGRFGLHNLPRTPYSRSIFSKSKSKSTQFSHLQTNGNRCVNSSFTPLKQLQTPIFGQTRRNTLENDHGFVGPIRRMRHKSVADSPFRGSVSSRSSLDGPQFLGNSNPVQGFLPAVNKNLEPVGSSSSVFQSGGRQPVNLEVGVPAVHPHSSQMARTILEHLERNPPTPKDKSAELKLVTSWRKSPSSDAALKQNERKSSLLMRDLDFSNRDQAENKNHSKQNEDRVNYSIAPQENTTYTVHATTGPSSSMNPQIKSGLENEKSVPDAADGEALNQQRKAVSQPVGNKPVLPSISIGKPDQKWTFSLNNSAGFSFPVSTSSGGSSEPPTPSIVPSFPAGGTNQPKEATPVPSFSFGLNRSTPPLAFTFPSSSSAPQNDASDLKFNFGSDSSKRISFSSIGKDAICIN